jgi:predicted NBD/HSP70 family sugar kinase
MSERKSGKLADRNLPVEHGAGRLPSVSVDSYNLRIRDGNKFIGDNASKSAYLEKLDFWRRQIDPEVIRKSFGNEATADLSRKEIDALLKGKDDLARAIVLSSVHDFAVSLAEVINRFLKEKSWKNTERIVVGGGLSESLVGRLAIAEAMLLLKAEGKKIDLQPIAHPADEAGLIGAVHLIPEWMLKGHEAMVGVDIGGTNIRAGIVKWGKRKKGANLAKANIWKMCLWRHGDESPSRKRAVKRLTTIIDDLIKDATKAKLVVAPVVGIACPGQIESDGAIATGGQNLPGNWESKSFNLANEITAAIPKIDGKESFVLIHNDAVVQGLSQIPYMTDVRHWGVLTIGTGLGNARFTRNS